LYSQFPQIVQSELHFLPAFEESIIVLSFLNNLQFRIIPQSFPQSHSSSTFLNQFQQFLVGGGGGGVLNQTSASQHLDHCSISDLE
jgi:hypothetical protein